jgi:DNA polymerase III subunit alpha
MTNKHQQLNELVFKGASEKNIELTETVLERLNYELSVIEKQDCADYFILFSRLIEICNDLKFIRTYGRGSAANSMVNYCLDITKINSVDQNLVFERFVLPEQKAWPDIDIDIPYGHQKHVMNMLKKKYPEYNTYFIAMTAEIYGSKDVVNNDIVYKKHPCGFIITPENLSESTFLYKNEEYYLALDIEKDKYFKEKIDILPLPYLNQLQVTVNEIGADYHPYDLPLDDKEVFDFFTSGDLENIFQFSEPSLKQILTQFKPDSINDLSIIHAMYRPNLMDYIQKIIKNKFNKPKPFCSSDPRVSEILKETYGILIYEETYLQLAKQIAGLSYANAEIWRRKVLSNNSRKELAQFKTDFASGCQEHSSLNKSDITALTKMVTKMLPLLFLKSHSLSHSIVGYWGAYYKTHFRTHFDIAFDKKNMDNAAMVYWKL